MQKKLTIAMDIDGTLVSKKGKLDPDVFTIFTKADLDNTHFILITGNSVTNALDCVDKINHILPEGKNIHPWISANCGATIINPQGEIVDQVSFSTKYITKLINALEIIDENVVFVFRDSSINFLEKQPLISKNNLGVIIYKLSEYIKGSAGVKLTHISKKFRTSLISLCPIQSMFTLTLDKLKKPALFQTIQKISQQFTLSNQVTYPVYDGTAIQTYARSKEEALNMILRMDSTLCQNIEDVIFFGDDTNDVACLTLCKYSFARGEKASPPAIDAAKYRYNDLSMVADALYSDELDFEKNMANLPKTEPAIQLSPTK